MADDVVREPELALEIGQALAAEELDDDQASKGPELTPAEGKTEADAVTDPPVQAERAEAEAAAAE